MFGYVKLYKPELKIKDYEAYKAVYCSLCKAIGKEYGVFARAFLSYDLTFYVLFRKAVAQEQCDHYRKGVCRFNPLKKCNYVADCDEIFCTAAALTILLSYYKIRDNIADGGFFKRLACYLIYPYIRNKFKKAKSKYPALEQAVSAAMQQQAAVEREASGSADRAADPSAKALAFIFSYELEDATVQKVAERFGYCLGRWIYLADAYDDIDNDLKNGNYNPYIIKYSIDSPDYNTDEIVRSLRLTANEAAMAFNLLELKQYKDVLSNIIYDGLEQQQLMITAKRGERARE